jgi:hypothetical protein
VELSASQFLTDLHEIELRGFWTLPRAAAELLLSTSTLWRYVKDGRLPSQHLGTAHGPVLVVPIREAKRVARERLKSDDSCVKLHCDSEWVAWWAGRRRLSGAHVAALVRRVRERNELARKFRVGVGGRPKSAGPPAHHFEWALAFAEIKRELDEQYEAYHLPGDPPPTKWEAALLVAEQDYEECPDRWNYSPLESPRPAARRVWEAVKPLQIAVTETH